MCRFLRPLLDHPADDVRRATSRSQGEAFVGLARRGDLSIVDQIVGEVEGEPGGLLFDAADEILKHVPDEPRTTAAAPDLLSSCSYNDPSCPPVC
jgi:hypothetical protein